MLYYESCTVILWGSGISQPSTTGWSRTIQPTSSWSLQASAVILFRSLLFPILPCYGAQLPDSSSACTMNLFRSRPDTSWVPVGPASSFPDLGEDTGSLLESRLCDAKLQPGCKIFRVPKDDPSKSEQVFLSSDDPEAPGRGDDLLDQVLIFRYRGRFHAVDHVSCVTLPRR